MDRLPQIAAVAVALTSLAVPVAAQTFEVRSYVQPAGTVQESRPIQLVVEVEGSDPPTPVVGGLPALKNLRVIQGPSTQQFFSTRSVNGRMEQSVRKSLLWTLIPEGRGPAEIPSIQVRVGNETRMTEPITLSVEAAPAGTVPRPDTGADQGDAAPVSIDARLSREEVWIGEPVTLEVQLFAGINVSNYDWVERPTFSNFWDEAIEVDPNAEATRRTIEGRRYVVYPVERHILVPSRAGEIELGRYRAQIGVQTGGRDIFERFLGGRTRSIFRQSKPLSLRVKPLPEVGRPAEFGGAVGQFRLEVTLDRQTAKVNDAVALRARVTGEGLLRAIPAPTLAPAPELKVFEPQVQQRTKPERGRLRSSKSWEWVLVPLAPGRLQLPELSFSYFDPATGTYETLTHESPVLVVERGDATDDRAVAHGEVRPQRLDISFIKPLRGSLAMDSPRIHRQPWFVGALVAPVVLSPLLIVLSRRRSRYLQDARRVRARRARTKARKQLRNAERGLSRSDGPEFHEEVARALVDYLADRFDRSGAGMTYDLADELLTHSGVDPALRQRVRSCLETCDFARYVPASQQAERKQEVLKQTQDIIEELERALR